MSPRALMKLAIILVAANLLGIVWVLMHWPAAR